MAIRGGDDRENPGTKEEERHVRKKMMSDAQLHRRKTKKDGDVKKKRFGRKDRYLLTFFNTVLHVDCLGGPIRRAKEINSARWFCEREK